MKMLQKISRIFVGVVFVFSGFVKGVDPLGTMYKIEDYFIAYDTQWALPLALVLSFILITVEFGVGAFLLLRVRMKFSSWLLMLMMVFFTIVTFFDALYNPVPDCGCFGEAIKLTNWETFYKNIILLIPTFIVFAEWRNKKRKRTYGVREILSVSLIAVFVAISIYSYNHLPIIDFRNWKEGKNMTPDNQGEPICYLQYKNSKTGQIKEYLPENLPWQDSVWLNNWNFVCQRIDYSNVNRVHDLQIVNNYGDDVTAEILENPEYNFIVVVNNFLVADDDGINKIISLRKKIVEGVHIIVLTSSLEKEINEFIEKSNNKIPVYQVDDIILKSMAGRV